MAAAAQCASRPSTQAAPEMLVTTAWLAEHLHDQVWWCSASMPRRSFIPKGTFPARARSSLGEIAVTRDGIPNELPAVEDLQQIFAAAGVSHNAHVVLYGERSNLFAARAYFTLDYLGVAGADIVCSMAASKNGRTEGIVLSPRKLRQSSRRALTISLRPGFWSTPPPCAIWRKKPGTSRCWMPVQRRNLPASSFQKTWPRRAHSRRQKPVLDGHAGEPRKSRC